MSKDPLKLAIIGLDGHGPDFTRSVNRPDAQVDGIRVVAAMPVPSTMISDEVLQQNVEATAAWGVEITLDPQQLVADADGVLILHDDGAKHLELAETIAPFGKPLFVDKPLEVSAEKARQLVETCRAHQCPVFTASALRFTPELEATLNDDSVGDVVSAMTYTPYFATPTMPGWVYYAIHGVEPLYALLGPNCRQVRCLAAESGPIAIGTWDDGRTGIVRALTDAHQGYGFAAWRGTRTDVAAVNLNGIYLGLLRKIKDFVQTATAPVDPEESIEVIAFMEAANDSMARDGEPVALAE